LIEFPCAAFIAIPGTTGWSYFYGGLSYGVPTYLWNPLAQGFALRTNQFGFNITGTAYIPIVVEASANLTSGAWIALQTCTVTNGLIYFSDPQWANYPRRYYRIRSP
jgi:hypothetical protein